MKQFLPLFVELSKSDGYWTVNKLFVKYFRSIEKALFLSELISKQSYFAIKKQLKDKEWFFLTYDKIKELTYISINKQRKFVKELVNDNIIDVKMMGIPAKQYYKINTNIIVELNCLIKSSIAENGIACPDEIKRALNNKEDKKKISSKEDKIPTESNSIDSDKPKTNKDILEISLFNKRVQNVFAHWQDLSNTTTHGESKARNEALKNLDYYIKKHSPKTIKQAMNVYNSLLENPFIMTTSNAPFKIGLNEFFKWGYSKNSLSKWKGNPVANIKSWFDICQLGQEEAERIMTKISKDDNPKVTKKLKKEFNNRIEKIKNPEPRDENAFILTSKYIMEFLKTNQKYLRIDAIEKRNPVLFVPYLYDYLKDNQNGNKQHPGWFTNDYFYDNFPVWMIKKGHMTESRKVKRR